MKSIIETLEKYVNENNSLRRKVESLENEIDHLKFENKKLKEILEGVQKYEEIVEEGRKIAKL